MLYVDITCIPCPSICWMSTTR